LSDTPQRAIACGVFIEFSAARILSFLSTFLLKTVFDQNVYSTDARPCDAVMCRV